MPLTLVEFYDLLLRHDWTYQYADDHRHYAKGERERRQIQFVMDQNEEYTPVFRDLYNRYTEWVNAPHGDVTKPERPE